MSTVCLIISTELNISMFTYDDRVTFKMLLGPFSNKHFTVDLTKSQQM